jgi:hypothetical protein
MFKTPGGIPAAGIYSTKTKVYERAILFIYF